MLDQPLGIGEFFFFNDTATTEIYTLSLHDALPILSSAPSRCSSVLLPLPDSPTIATISPASTSRWRCSNTTRSAFPERNFFSKFSARNKVVTVVRCSSRGGGYLSYS